METKEGGGGRKSKYKMAKEAKEEKETKRKEEKMKLYICKVLKNEN